MRILFAYWGIGIVVAIITATRLRVYRHKKHEEDDGVESTFWGIVYGGMWPLTLVGWVVYLVSGFLCRIINAKKEG